MHDEWGIADGFHDVEGRWHVTSDETRASLRAAMGTPLPGPPLLFAEPGWEIDLPERCTLRLEDGTSRGELGRLPDDLPLGYHDLLPAGGGAATRLVVHPHACPPPPRLSGVAAQVYALWSDTSWGIGDLRDLRTLADQIRAGGGDAVLVNPLHQAAPSLPQEPSPYYPSTRRAWSPLLLAMDDLPPPGLAADPERLIDRDAIWVAKRARLEADFAAATAAGLTDHLRPDSVAVWNALCDVFGPRWQAWPHRRHDPRRATFHQWLQDRVAAQLADVRAAGVTLIGDLAIGCSPAGADACEFAHVSAPGAVVGAPPDPFARDGQSWGFHPFVPWRLRNDRYRPLIRTLRAAFRGVDGLRIDHVLGFFRQYWIPTGRPSSAGAYVRFPHEELLAILCLEATRAGAFVVGEDLGTVEPWIRDQLRERRIAGTKVFWFEDQAPPAWPELSLGTITNHDLPTIAGAWERTDGDAAMRDRLRGLQVPDDAPAADVIAAAHHALMTSGSAIRLMTADDLAGARRRANLPGTNDYPSWRVRLPVSVDELRPRFAG